MLGDQFDPTPVIASRDIGDLGYVSTPTRVVHGRRSSSHDGDDTIAVHCHHRQACQHANTDHRLRAALSRKASWVPPTLTGVVVRPDQ